MRKIVFFGALILCLKIYAEPVHSLVDALKLTLLNHSELTTFNYDMRASDARIWQAGFRPNPVLDVETENLGAPIFAQTTLLLSQVIEIGSKRKARLQHAFREKDKVFMDYEVRKRELFVETTLLFIEVLVNQEKISFLEENLKTLKEFSSTVENRVKAGRASVIEEANFTVLLATAMIDLNNGISELKSAKQKLAAQWNETNNSDFFVVGELNWTPQIAPLEELGSLIEEHPQVLHFSAEDNLRAARIGLERSKAYSDVNLRGGPRYLKEANKWVFVLGFTMPLPINDRNQGRIYESFENFQRLEKEREGVWTKLLTELNTSYSTLEKTYSELNVLQNILLPAATRAYDFSYKGYELARYNYLELLEAAKNYRNNKIRYLEILGEYRKALARLEGLTGSNKIIQQQCELWHEK